MRAAAVSDLHLGGLLSSTVSKPMTWHRPAASSVTATCSSRTPVRGERIGSKILAGLGADVGDDTAVTTS